jgi:hypothetical protein
MDASGHPGWHPPPSCTSTYSPPTLPLTKLASPADLRGHTCTQAHLHSPPKKLSFHTTGLVACLVNWQLLAMQLQALWSVSLL